MLAYKYDETTKEYLGTQTAQVNPLEGGYLLPANCIFIEAPEYSEKQIPVFENGAWVVKTDNRGSWQVKLDDIIFSKVDYIGEVHQGYQVITDEQYEEYQADNDRFKVIDGVFTDIYGTPEYEEIKRRKEQERINNLTMTALDFIGVLEGFGLNYVTQIKPFLEANQDLDKQLKYCQNVYCGVAKQVFIDPITIGDITVTAQMVEQAFKTKNGEA